jgi:hypothetical protein
MTDISTKLLAGLGGLALAFVLGVGTGQRLAHTAAVAAGVKAAEARAVVLEKARVTGETSVAALGVQVADIRSNQNTVEKRTTHAPLLATAPACRVAPSRGPAVPAPVHAAGLAGPAAAETGAGPAGPGLRVAGAAAAAGLVPPGVPADVSGGGVDPGLSLGAVSLWNSALAGHDVPAGACRADDTTSAACAAGANVSLAAAWRNHAANAASCAEDRARYQHLIDFLRATR